MERLRNQILVLFMVAVYLQMMLKKLNYLYTSFVPLLYCHMWNRKFNISVTQSRQKKVLVDHCSVQQSDGFRRISLAPQHR